MKRKQWAILAGLLTAAPLAFSQGVGVVGIDVWQQLLDSNGGDDKNDLAYGVAFDSQGNVVIAGNVDAPQTGTPYNDNALVLKYDPDGNELWRQEYDSGDVEGTNCNIQKCDSRERFYALRVDPDDRVVLAGKWDGSWAASPQYISAFWIMSLSPDGQTINWDYKLEGSSSSAWNAAYALDVDDAGNVFSAGDAFHGWNNGEHDWVMYLHDASGTVASGFPLYYDYSSDYLYADMAFGAAIDSAGNLIATGRIGISQNNLDWHVRKYDASGSTLLWSDTLDGNGLYDWAGKVTTDASNDVYVAGALNTGTDNGDNHHYQWVVIKYAAGGDGSGGAVRLWTRTYDGLTSGADAVPNDLVWDPVTDTLIVVGRVTDETTGLMHARLERLDADTGALLREQLITGTTESMAVGVHIQEDRIAFTGGLKNATDWDMATFVMRVPSVAITPNGSLVTTEAGGSATFDVVLEDEPTGDVTIQISSSNLQEGQVSPSTLVFTPGTWNTPQTVTITGVEDNDDDGDQAYSIQFTISSSDPIYDTRTIQDLPVTNQNNDPLFADVPLGYWAYTWIQALADSGITSGCDASNYCPGDDVRRDAMAVFLERGIHGSDYMPPAATGTVFADVPASHWAAAWIEGLNADGITAGCGGGNYCPSGTVNRDQMAVFLLRSEHGSGYSPPPATGTMFADVPQDHWAAAWIEQLATEGITSGCDASNYCPDDPVRRDAMAVFLTRAFNLLNK